MANEVEVKITASTDALSEGMNQATNKVQAAATDINRIADTIKSAFDGVRESLKNIDISLNIDMSAVQQKLVQATNTIKTKINSIADDASIKLKIDTASLNAEIGHAETLIRNRLSSLPIQNLQLDINIHDLQQKFNQLGAQTIKVKPKLDTSALTTEIALIKNKLNVAFSNGIKVKILPTLLQADISNLKTKLQGLTNKTYKVKLGIDLTYLNNQINIARSMLSNINSGLVINIDATSNLLRASLDRLKVSIDLLRHQMGSSGGGSGGPAGGGGGGAGGSGFGGGMLASFGGNILANAVSNLTAQLSQLFSEALRNAREIENMSRLANTSTQEFQEWAFASKTVGVSQEKLGDIMKDVNDKFGDFMQTGGGEMADFFEKIAPKVGVTAKEFQGLSGPQILGKYYDTLQKANVSQAEMTFYMESIANDATLLAPLLANNGEKIKELGKQAHDLGIILSDEAIQATKEFQGALGSIGSTIKGVVANILADLAPALKQMSDNFLTYMVDSKDAVDSSIAAIISIFESLGGIVNSIVTLIGDLWSDLTQDIGDGSLEQVTFMDMVSGALKGFAAVAVGLKVAIELAFAAIRVTITTVCEVIKVAINTVLNTFGGFRDTIQYGLDYLGIKFKTFGSVVESILSFDFAGAKANWERGLSDISNLTDQYANRMQMRLEDIQLGFSTSVGKVGGAINTAVDSSTKTTTAGLGVLKTQFLGGDKKEDKAPPPSPAPTFNTNKGIGTGVKDDGKKSEKKDKDDESKSKGPRLVGISGNTGIGTGAHLDVRYGGALDGQKVSAEHLARLQAAGKSLSAYKVTSDYGPRKAPTVGASTFHKGTDFAMPVGTAITTNHAVKDVNTRNGGGKSGYVAEVTFDDGVVLKLLHQSASIMKNVKGGASKAGKGSSKSGKSDYEREQEELQRKEEKAQKDAVGLRYKYANEEKKVALDLEQSLKDIQESSKLSDAEKTAFKVEAEKEASEKVKAIHVAELLKLKALDEEEIQQQQIKAQRIYEQEMANIQALFDAGKLSNTEKIRREQQLEEQLYQIKRNGLLARLELEQQVSSLTGDTKNVSPVLNDISTLDHEKSIKDSGKPKSLNDAELADFEKKFGGLTSRMSGLWDQGMQAMMNGTLTWKSAMSAIFSELAMEFIQKMITAPLKESVAAMAPRLAAKLGLIKAETALEVTGQTAQTGAVVVGEAAKTSATGVGTFARLAMRSFEAVKSIMISAWQAMANALASAPPPWNIALGGLAFAGVAALAGKVASARGGYDIPAGVNPMTQLHEEEMVLPKQHANTIRALGKSVMGDGGGFATPSASAQTVNSFTIHALDAKSVKRLIASNGPAIAQGLQSHVRNFGKK